MREPKFDRKFNEEVLGPLKRMQEEAESDKALRKEEISTLFLELKSAIKTKNIMLATRFKLELERLMNEKEKSSTVYLDLLEQFYMLDEDITGKRYDLKD